MALLDIDRKQTDTSSSGVQASSPPIKATDFEAMIEIELPVCLPPSLPCLEQPRTDSQITDPHQPAPSVAVNRPALLWALSLATFGSGLLNLYSLIGPALPKRVRLLREIFPLEFLHLSRFLTLLIGFSLIISSVNIYKRKKRAFYIVLSLAGFSIVFHLAKGLDYEEALFSFLLLLGLIFARQHFTVRSRVPDLNESLLRLALALGSAVGYGVVGFWLLDRREFGIDFSWKDAIQRTFAILSLVGDPQLVPQTRYAHWFLDSLHLITFATVGYMGIAIFRPVLYAFQTLPHERLLAQQIVCQYSRSSLDYFKSWPDKSFLFSPSGRSFLAYGVRNNFALALADPVGPEEELEAIVRSFMDLCAESDWGIGFHQTLPDFLPIYKKLGFRKLKIGDDAIVDLTQFSLEGKAKKDLRSKLNLLEKQGVHIRFYEPPIADEVVSQAKSVSDDWLRIPGRRERSFTLGRFEPDYIRSMPLFAAVDAQGNWLAFANLIPSYTRGESAVDLMRRRTETPNGIMDYLFVKLLFHLKAQGFQRFNFGMAPMAGFQEREEASAEEKAIHYFFQRLNFLFSFRGLRAYKAKFATSWEPRYAIYRNVHDLPRLAITLSKLSESPEED